jgi:hypothetical protein
MSPQGETKTEARPKISKTKAEPNTEGKLRTPLGLMAIFVTLTETALGTVATQTTGTVQMLLTIFVITFPVLIAAAFFAILWDRPHHLYHPSEYTAGTTAEIFERATRPRLSDLDAVKALLPYTVDVLDGDRAKALVASIAAGFIDIEPFIATQYSADIAAADADGSKARKVLKRLVVLTVRGTEDVEKWQGAIGAL